jgi:hypothetical protein
MAPAHPGAPQSAHDPEIRRLADEVQRLGIQAVRVTDREH